MPRELNNINKCYRWKENSVEIYQKTIKQQRIQILLDNFLYKMFHCNSEGVNLAVENLNSIFDLSASLSNLISIFDLSASLSKSINVKQTTEENEQQ